MPALEPSPFLRSVPPTPEIPLRGQVDVARAEQHKMVTCTLCAVRREGLLIAGNRCAGRLLQACPAEHVVELAQERLVIVPSVPKYIVGMIVCPNNLVRSGVLVELVRDGENH